jgi:hypothetical protein
MLRGYFSTILALVAGTILCLAMATAALAAANPAGTGQPGAECGEEGATIEPHGFTTKGFENAEEHYAGEGSASLNHANSEHAVSQYDVACFQVTSNH